MLSKSCAPPGPSSKSSTELGFNVRPPMPSDSMLAPGARCPPGPTVTIPETDPVPPSVPPFTVIGPVVFAPLNNNNPALITTGPKLLLPLRISVAAPFFVNVPVPVIVPANVVLPLAAPSVNPAAPCVTAPPVPASDATVSVMPFISSVPPFTVMAELLEKPAALFDRSTPALTVTGPLNVFAPLSRIVPAPFLVSPPFVIGVLTSTSTSSARLPIVKMRVPPPRSTLAEAPEIVAV